MTDNFPITSWTYSVPIYTHDGHFENRIIGKVDDVVALAVSHLEGCEKGGAFDGSDADYMAENHMLQIERWFEAVEWHK